jgi:nitroimidazol reductase NimA-like FMN-containing flavoprotein (pyridoxamine 5'-phosphate oxidase superfamily)
MPGDYLTPKRLAWPWAESRLAESRNYWITTVCADGLPHARPVWGVWLEGRLYFSSGSRIRAHLERSPAVSVNLESGDECVILEGSATLVQDEALTRRIVAAYNEKYHWDLEAKPGEFFEARPRVVFGWLCDGTGRDGGALFSQTATRWRFDEVASSPPDEGS